MFNPEFEQNVHSLFVSLSDKCKQIAQKSDNGAEIAEQICHLVSSELATVTDSYIIDIYNNLVAELKKEEYFQDPKRLNDFYRLDLRSKLNEKFHFDIKSVEAYKNDIVANEVNELYAAAGAAAGTLALGGILKYALSSVINIPFAVIIAGAVLSGLGTREVVKQNNRRNRTVSVDEFLKKLESDILDWLEEIQSYFASQVRSVYTV